MAGNWWSDEPEDVEAHPCSELLDLVRSGDAVGTQHMLEVVASVPGRRPAVGSPLIEAVRHRRYNIVDLLLASAERPDLEAADPVFGGTALHWAARLGDYTATRQLLREGADPNARSLGGLTPLHCAVVSSNREVVQLLLEKGAQVDAADDEMQTPLTLAARLAHVGVVDALLSRGASPAVASLGGMTPLLAAVCSGHAALCSTLLAGASQGSLAAADTMRRRGCLHWASYHGHLPVLSLLLASPALMRAVGIDPRDARGDTPLLLASSRGHAPVAGALLAAGAGANSFNAAGVTPLLAASFFGHAEVVKVLVEHGADVHAADPTQGRTPLHWAAASDSADIVRVLLVSGAEISAMDRTGLTPAQVALEMEAAAAARELQGGGRAPAEGSQAEPIVLE